MPQIIGTLISGSKISAHKIGSQNERLKKKKTTPKWARSVFSYCLIMLWVLYTMPSALMRSRIGA